MLRSLGLHAALKWFVIACVVVALWRGFNGDLGAIADTLWSWVVRGADVLTSIWQQIQG